MLNILISSLMFLLLIAFGHLLLFVDPIIYLLCPFYFLLLILLQKMYKENCKTMEAKDFLVITLFSVASMLLYIYADIEMSFDAFTYIYLATFISYISYASSIRYKSLI